VANQIRILIADDHPIVRKGVRQSLEEDANLTVIAEAGDGETALALIQELKPDIAILDIEMPKLDGLVVARRIAELCLETRIIFLTLHKDEDLFGVAIDVGGKGYLLKDSAAQEIIEGVRAVSDGRLYVSPAIAATFLGRRPLPISSPVNSLTAQLTPTERRILKLIVEGKSSKEIGIELSIHYRTVENHRTNICRKFGVEGANALLRFALQYKAAL
jgi:DNA-binding NarL/FixJ family response regulator